MNTRVNPLYIVLFFGVVFLFSLNLYFSSKNSLEVVNDEYKMFYQNATELKNLKSRWGENSKSEIQKIMNDKQLKSNGLDVIFSKNTAMLKLSTTDNESINRVLTKVLNLHLEIKKITIENKEQKSVYIEIAL